MRRGKRSSVAGMLRKPLRKPKKGRSVMAANNEEKNTANGEVREGQNVDKIRDILFGSQMRDYEKRFVRLEERLAKASDALRDDLKKRFDSLESFVQQEMEALGQRLKTEKSERAEALKELTRETRDSAKSLEKKLSALEEQLSSAQGDLRARILEQSKSLGNEIRKAQTEMEAALEREAEALRHEKTDRESLGDMFAELGMRLKGELELPEK
jgi:DNA repair exonuclease SbcCD ATPase subunit